MHDIDDILRDARSRTWSSVDELNAWLAEKTGRYNEQPQKELGGLSPEQAARLLAGDWDTKGPLRLNASLRPAELRHARFFNNPRTFLSAVAENVSVKATSAGNLNRKFVSEMLERMEWEPGWIELIRHNNKVINEEDAFRLHELRFVLTVAGLIKLRSGQFTLTRRGAALLPEAEAGKLFAHLVRTFFRRFNLAFLDRGRENQALQSTLPITLYGIGCEARKWIKTNELADRALHPAALDQPMDYLNENPAYFQFESRVVRPLEAFGLMEKRELTPEKSYRSAIEARKSSLFDRFLRFEF